ncbi:LytR/AlgR family response regulator transcription factor [Paraflavitalea pollutisoli]|uniref:LytR/AlgR family response regulator transcription factor n=1 Tax=Paraflavitalea pollutisoli TaxID=3034143 RepID=UPI0023EB1962|nr:LytTR family DNA-binding domain-containing protein [Paraflavitalea sp. H1-2-19X]
MIRYLIVDDEFMAHDIIKGYCDLLPDMRLVKHCYDALSAFEHLQSNEVDLVFLDLHMPVLKGFELLKLLERMPRVIVTTAYQEHALEGYEYAVADYLLKPFSFERMLKAVNKAFSGTVSPFSVPSTSNAGHRHIFLQSNKKFIQVKVDAVLVLEATGNYTKVVLLDEMILVREKISALLESLPAGEFLQVHKSFVVARNHIRSIEGNCLEIGDRTIPIGGAYRTNVLKLLG